MHISLLFDLPFKGLLENTKLFIFGTLKEKLGMSYVSLLFDLFLKEKLGMSHVSLLIDLFVKEKLGMSYVSLLFVIYFSKKS